MKWQIDSIGKFYDRHESMVVYFNPASGDTHLISEFAACLIQRIADQKRPLDNEEITALITADIEPGGLPELTQVIPDILSELTALDIIAPA